MENILDIMEYFIVALTAVFLLYVIFIPVLENSAVGLGYILAAIIVVGLILKICFDAT